MTDPVQTPETLIEGQPDPNAGLAEARDRYRGERDTARAELETANALIDRFRRAELERIAGESLAMPGDLLSLSGNTTADYLDDDGNVDPEKIATDVAEILAERPGLQRPAPAADRSQGLGTTAETRPNDFSRLFSD